MRNPWRVSQDPVTGLIWCADVGQNAYEEIDLIENGRNYGWRIMEGLHCYNPPTGCNMTGLTLPIKEYGHAGSRCSVTGGFVYRGSRRPDLLGRYIYADYCTGEIWKLRYQGGTTTEDSLLLSAGTSVLSFGTDQNTELYVLGNNGIIYRFNRSCCWDMNFWTVCLKSLRVDSGKASRKRSTDALPVSTSIRTTPICTP